MLAAAQAQPRRDGGHRLAVAEKLQRQGLPRHQDPIVTPGSLLQELPRRRHVGEGAASKAPVGEPLDTRQAEQGRVEQAITVGPVPQRVVDSAVGGGERPPTAARRRVRTRPS